MARPRSITIPAPTPNTQDLDFGRQAATWQGWTPEEGIALLPRLWQYTLLRCSLTSRADHYPLEAFRLLVLLKRKQEALGLAELLTDPANKVQALLQIAKQLREQSDQEKEWLALLLRAGEIAHTIKASYDRAEALRELGTALAQAQQWDRTQAVIGTIEESDERAEALAALGTALAQAQQWDRAQAVIGTIEQSYSRAGALRELGTALAQAQQWERAQAVIGTIEGSDSRAGALAALGTALAQAQQWERAQAVWKEAQAVIGTIKESYSRARALRELGTALAQAQQWDRAEAVIGTLEERPAGALAELAAEMAEAGEDEMLLHLIQRWWRHADKREDALKLFPLVTGFIPRNPELGAALHEASTWVDAFLKG